MRRRVAVLGAGIMGSATAMFAARQGAEVMLYDAAPEPFTGASRWNEGKIHLGFLYAGDPSLRTARRVLPGGLAFRPLVEQLLDGELEGITETGDTVLVHRDSVVPPDAMRAYVQSLSAMIRSHPAASTYLTDVADTPVRELSEVELEAVGDPAHVTAGFSTPERSISTRRVADRFVDALAAEDGIELRMSTRVLGVRADDDSLEGPFRVTTTDGSDGPFEFVVNALWEGRPRVDATLGINPNQERSHRYRLALFVETDRRLRVPCAVVCTGPFGDIKNYDDREFYISWYPAGLIASGRSVDPPRVPQIDTAKQDAIIADAFRQLGRLIPSVGEVRDHAIRIRLEGGWVYAVGSGKLSDPGATLHRRDQLGVNRVGSYFSIDTGKYSVAPLLARQVADAIARF